MAIELPIFQQRYIPLLAKITLAVYCALIIYLCLIPISEAPPVKIWDKAAHALAYMGFTSIAVFCTHNTKHFYYYLLAFIFFGIGIEVAQNMTTYRSFSYLDMLANTTGVMIGFVLAWITNKVIKLPCF